MTIESASLPPDGRQKPGQAYGGILQNRCVLGYCSHNHQQKRGWSSLWKGLLPARMERRVKPFAVSIQCLRRL